MTNATSSAIRLLRLSLLALTLLIAAGPLTHAQHAPLVRHSALGRQVALAANTEASAERHLAGRITGRVTDAQTGQPLPSASVVLSGMQQGTATGPEGRYTLRGVPAGERTLVVSYIGYEEETVRVRVEDDGTTTQDVALAPAVIEGQEVTVLGLRAQGQARALNAQKNAPNIVNVVASDQFGRFPDATAPEALQRLPSLSVQRDQGEGRYVQIRGGSPQNTLVTFNGVRVPSPEGEERQIQLDAVPVDLLERIRVTKALTPDQDAEAIGGSVDLETKKGPEERFLSAEVAGGYGTIREDPTYKLAGTYGDRVADDRLGFLATASYRHRDFGSDDVEPIYDIGDPDRPEDDALVEHETRYYDILRARLGVTGSMDYRLAENSELYVRGVFTQLRDDEYQPNLISIIEDGELEYEHKDRLETARSISIAGGGEHLLGDLGLNYDLSWTRSIEDTPRENELLFARGDVSFSPSLGDDPEDIQPNPSSVGPLAFDEFVDESKYITNTNLVAEADFDRPYRVAGMTGTFEFGGKFRRKNADQEVTVTEYGLVDGATDVMLGEDVGSPFSLGDYNPGRYVFPDFAVDPSVIRDFTARYADRLEGEVDLEADTEDYDLTEDVAAAYVMTQLDVTDRLLVLPGVRYEHTFTEAQGNAFDPEAETLSPTNSENDYGQLFPALHVRYRLTPNTNLRAAATRALARPNYFFLVPYRIRDGNDLELGNPDLDPTTSLNLDLMLEHYTSSIGAYSAGVFYKRLQDPVLIFRGELVQDGETFQATQPRNGESGRIWGVEVSAQQQLRFLPGVFSGLGFFANYTYTQSQSTLLSGRELPFPGQSDHLLNASLSYERGGFSGQLSLNYTGDFLEEVGEDGEGSGRYIDERVGLDVSATYDFGMGLSAYVEVVNLLNEPLYAYQSIEERPLQREFYERWGWTGLRYNL